MGNKIKYFNFLKETFPFYLSSGIICAILIFLMVVLNNYSDHLEEKLTDMRKIALNKQKITSQVRKIDDTAAYLKEEFDLDVSDINPDILIFNAIEEIKKTFANPTIRVSNVGDPGGGTMYNVDIEMPVKDYAMLAASFQYLESFRIPKFKPTYFSFNKGESGAILLRINGKFLMPSL